MSNTKNFNIFTSIMVLVAVRWMHPVRRGLAGRQGRVRATRSEESIRRVRRNPTMPFGAGTEGSGAKRLRRRAGRSAGGRPATSRPPGQRSMTMLP